MIGEHRHANYRYKVWAIQAVLAVNPKHPEWSMFNAGYLRLKTPRDDGQKSWLKAHPEFAQAPSRCRWDGTAEGEKYTDCLVFREPATARACLKQLREDASLSSGADQFRLVSLEATQEMLIHE